VLILTIFYRYIPNTRVIWRAAIIGAIIVTALLFLNNYLAFLYFRQVVSQKSLYGSLGILPVLMVGLYIFWFFILLGGQIAYAVQNVHFRSSQIAWHNLSEATRESLSLLVLLMISRRFRECLAPYSASQLGERTKTPTQILNESLNRLTDLQLITAIPPAEGQSALDYRYQPARPLDKITLSDFRRLFTTKGENPSGESLDAIDPILVHYHERIDAHIANTIGSANLAELLERFPLPQEED
jgi:membrane protein